MAEAKAKRVVVQAAPFEPKSTRVRSGRLGYSAEKGLLIDGKADSFARLTKEVVRGKNKSALEAEINRQLGAGRDSVTAHINRDGSIAFSLGVEPAIWPEDEI